MLQDMLRQPLLPWQKKEGKYSDVVLDSRVRLVRNMDGCPFPIRAKAADLEKVLTAGKAQQDALQAIGHGSYTYTALTDVEPLDRELLAFHHLSTAAHIEQPQKRALLLRNDGAVSILLNETDHFCIQTAAAGFDLQQVWDDAAQIDDTLESHINFAFRDDVGYLTTSPTMTGTGLIAGVHIHIPAIVAMKRLNRIVQGITKFGFAIGCMYGERGSTLGNVFQITNQITLGVSETDILEQLHRLVLQIIQEERNCRAILWSHEETRWVDKAFRAYGILSYAALLEEEEAISLSSDVRLGIDQGILGENPLVQVAMLSAMEPTYLQATANEGHLSDELMLKERARVIRQLLKEYAVTTRRTV